MRKRITLLLFTLVAFVAGFAQDATNTGQSHGALVVNEDWYGHQNSSVNYLSPDGKWSYNVVENVGCTACFGAIFNDKFYIISKTAKDPGATVSGGMITICNANTLAVEKQIENIDKSKLNLQGRSFVGVSAEKGYVSTSDGIYVLDLEKQEITKEVTDESGMALQGECGNMILKGEKVYAVTNKNGLVVINTETDQVGAVFEGAYRSIVCAKDGSLWANTASSICRLNTETMKAESVTLAEGMHVPAVDYAWTPGTFCASAQNNVLYWGYASGWTGVDHIYKYDIDKNECTEIVDLTKLATGWFVYGCSFRVNPVTDHLFMSLFKNWGSTDYTVYECDADGHLLADYPMTGKLNYWFPGMFVFPSQSVTTSINLLENTAGKETTPVAYYAPNGQRLAAPAKGLNIVRMSDGTTRKVILK